MNDAMQGTRGVPPAPTLEYPLRYTFKVMGLAADDFAEYARRLVAGVLGGAAAEARTRQSSGGKYHSVSVVVQLESEAQRRAVYQALYQDDRVVYYL